MAEVLTRPAGETETSTQRSVIVMEDVSKRFANGTLALSGMSLTVPAGAFVSLLGPSGCGKSTALRLVAGLARPSEGRIERHDKRDAVSFVFQEPTLLPWATVWRNVWLPLRLHRVSRQEACARVDGALALVGLERFGASYPRELSGGMKMRVSIARALVTRPTLLLMDEPFAALDEITRQRLNDDLLRLWREFRWTVLFVTHSVNEAVYLSNRIVVMAPRPGRVVADVANARDAEGPDRSSPGFAAATGRISRLLNDATSDETHP